MKTVTRRDVLGSAALVGGWLALGAESAVAQDKKPSIAGGPYTLPDLEYGFADLEPHIDGATMKLHHDRHHASYVRKANAALDKLRTIRGTGGESIKEVRNTTEALSFNLSGHLLHSIFWKNMKPDGGGEPNGTSAIGKLIKRDFGSYAAFAGNFGAAAGQVSGSGWGILAWEPNAERLIVLQAEKHQNLGVWGCTPLLAIDVWEHAYYLKYQNMRSTYIKAFMNVTNWSDVDARLGAATE